jgi:competence protein ComEC
MLDLNEFTVIRRGLVLTLCSLAWVCSLRGQEPTRFVVRGDAAPCLNFRPRPQGSAKSIECLTPRTSLEAVGTAPYWRQVRLADGRIGWVAKKFVEVAFTPAVAPETEERGDAWLEVHVVDVGQGDGIWIHTFDDNIPGNGRYEGYNIIVDGGPDASDTKNQLLKYVLGKAHEGAVIDALIITHPHDDHYPGAEGILRHFEVREVYDSGYPKEGAKWAHFRALVDSEKFEGQPIAEHVGRANFGTPNWGNELQVRFLYAYPGSPTGLGSGNTLENNASIVFRLEYGSQSILFMGDAEGKDRGDSPNVPKYAERFLLDSVGPAGLHSTVLKIAHHGSETSSTIPFINAVDPDYVVVSSGRKPFAGNFLPDVTTLERYCAHKPATRIYRTDQDDEAEGRTPATDADSDQIIVSTNGKETRLQAYSAGSPISLTSCVP